MAGVRLVGISFFYAARGERFDIAIELALAFHCSPSEFLDTPDHLLETLYERTALIMRRMNS